MAAAPALRLAALGVAAVAVAAPLTAQQQPGPSRADSVAQAIQPARAFSWPTFAAGFLASLLAHEGAHFLTAFAVGGDPSLGFDGGRPVVYSGIDPAFNPGDQFAFSAAGMTVQLLLNELILDWPHDPGPAGEFERGVLAGGIGTVVFYFTVGRTSEVGDVYHMERNSGLSTWALTAIYGGVALSDVVRIALKERYAHFFAFPGPDRNVLVGVTLDF